MSIRFQIIVAAILLAALTASLWFNLQQVRHVNHLSEQLAQAQAERETAQAQRHYQHSQQLAAQLSALQQQAASDRRAVNAALQQHPNWANEKLPEHIKKAIAK